MRGRPLVDCSIQAGRALEGARHVTENGSMLGPNPFLVPASYPLPFGSSHLSSPNSPPTPAMRRDIQWHQKMEPTCSVRPLALRDETYKTSATDAAGLPNNPGCPHSSSRRKGAKRKGRPLCPMHIDSEDDSGGLRRD
jgi:hypothetical protein